MTYRRAHTGFGLTEEHLAAIGSVCVAWGQAEQSLNFLIGALMPIADLKAKNVFAGTIGMRHKIILAKHLARLRIVDNTKFEIAEGFLNRLSDYAPERNRIVHDLWALGASTSPTRLQLRPAIRKPKAGDPAVLMTVSEVSMSARDIRYVTDAIASLSQAITIIAFFYLRDQERTAPWEGISHMLPPKPKPDKQARQVH